LLKLYSTGREPGKNEELKAFNFLALFLYTCEKVTNENPKSNTMQFKSLNLETNFQV
jgi:hypothetical protein